MKSSSYSVGKLASQLGLTPDFIKYYEKHNIMKPRIEENGYRAYDISSTATINECVKYRDMGFSASDIETLMLDCDYESTINIFNENIPMLQRKLAHTQIILDYMNEIKTEFPRYSQKNPWTIEESEEMYYLPISKNFEFIGDPSIAQLLQEWQKFQPAVIHTARVDYRSVNRKVSEEQENILDKLEWGVLITKANLEKLGLQTNSQVLRIAPQKFLTVYDRRVVPPKEVNENLPELKEKMFHNTIRVLQRYPFTVTGPSFFIVRSKILEEGVRYTYQKVMTPIE